MTKDWFIILHSKMFIIYIYFLMHLQWNLSAGAHNDRVVLEVCMVVGAASCLYNLLPYGGGKEA